MKARTALASSEATVADIDVAYANTDVHPISLLIIDDDPLSRMHLEMALSPQFMHVAEAASGEEGLQALAEKDFDIVLLDVRMPGMDGFEVCQRIRRGRTADVPIVMLTGADDIESISKALECGANDFVTKPFRTSLLAQRVRHIVSAHRGQQALDQQRSEQAALIDALPDSIFRFSRSGKLIGAKVGSAAPRILRDSMCPGIQLEDMFGDTEGSIASNALLHAVEAGQSRIEIHLPGRSSQSLELRFALIPSSDVLCVIRDITQQEMQKRRIEMLSLTEPTTGLPNRAYLLQLLQCYADTRPGQPLSLVQVCFSGLETISESMGRYVAERALKRIGEIISGIAGHCVQSITSLANNLQTLVACTGNTTFHIIVPDSEGYQSVQSIVDDIFEALDHVVDVDHYALSLPARMGVTQFLSGEYNVEVLLQQSALAAKAGSGSACRSLGYYQPELERNAVKQIALEGALRSAIANQEIAVVYQPKLCALTQQICGVEALVRWQSDEFGQVSPADFIPLAEETGLILSLGDYVLETACRQAVEWRRQGFSQIPIAVNVSGHQFNQKQFDEKVYSILRETGATATDIELEITESVFMDPHGMAIELLEAFRAKGIGIALDDFGTGFSSLSMLKKLPLDVLKIDRSFVSDILEDDTCYGIVDAIVAMGKAQNLKVVAEGVETALQLSYLRKRGCDVIQGYLTGKPSTPYVIETSFLQQNGPYTDSNVIMNRANSAAP